ncbi:MAG: hypothetical protein KC502_18770 [Myxococcales bacterium]|nr:hypothetical protein [Myxococcales bacterium]
MIELTGVLAILLFIVSSGAALLLPWDTLALVGGWLLAIGAISGIPPAIVYHLRLYQTLHPQGLLPDNWYWNPVRYNDLLLDGAERKRVMLWFWLGVLGFAIVLLGVLALGGAAVKIYLRP